MSEAITVIGVLAYMLTGLWLTAEIWGVEKPSMGDWITGAIAGVPIAMYMLPVAFFERYRRKKFGK